MENDLKNLIDSMKKFSTTPQYPTRNSAGKISANVSPNLTQIKNTDDNKDSSIDVLSTLQMICIKFDALSTKRDNYQRRLKEKEADIVLLQEQNEEKDKFITSLHSRIDILEQNALSDLLVVSGMNIRNAITNNLDGQSLSKTSLINVLNDDLSVQLSQDAINKIRPLKNARMLLSLH